MKLGGIHINQNALRVKVEGPVFLLRHHICDMKTVSNTEGRKEIMYILSSIKVSVSQNIM
jgi:hypothetical protein